MLPFQLYYDGAAVDMASCKVKYEEGYVQMFGHIVTKPEFLWTQADRDLITPTVYVWGFRYKLEPYCYCSAFGVSYTQDAAKHHLVPSPAIQFYKRYLQLYI
ncbi:hypothetical protein PS6_004281 [Mucor atramentarius]